MKAQFRNPDKRTTRHSEATRKFVAMWNAGRTVGEIAAEFKYAQERNVYTRAAELRGRGYDLIRRPSGRKGGGFHTPEGKKRIRESHRRQRAGYVQSSTRAQIMNAKGEVIGELISDGDTRTRVMRDGRKSVQRIGDE